VQEPAAAALHDLRVQRRRKRLAGLDWFDAAYRAYLTAILGIVLTLLVSSWLGDERVTAAGLARVEEHGPAVVGLVVAALMALGLRSGSRGGPLAVEAAEVSVVLMAPVRRRSALVGIALKQLRFGVFVGAVVGAVSGQLAHRRLPGAVVAWVAVGVAIGMLMALAVLGAALLASGLRLPRWAATLTGAALLGWAAADLAGAFPAPTSTIGSLALWPVRVHPVDIVGALALVAITAAGLALLDRVSVEALERRTSLVGQLRFAVTVQDLRTVIVLRRQLALDTPRLRPWFGIGRRGRLTTWRRCWHGLLRFPLVRLGRMLLLTVLAGVALGYAYAGSAALVVPAALALFLVGLDAVEPLSQEIDHPDRNEQLPVDRGELLLRFVPASALALLLLAPAVFGGMVLVDASGTALTLAAIVALPAVWCGGAGAITSVTMGAPEPSQDGQLLPPEVAGMKIAFRTAWPMIVALVGTLPVLLARVVANRDGQPIAAATQAVLLALFVIAMTVAWVRFREPAKAWWKGFIEEGQSAAKARQRTPA
jgi:hypothetical protein